LQQLTKPEKLNNELVVNVQLTNNNIKVIHEALVAYMRNKEESTESNALKVKELREEFNKLRILFNPS
jgi:hypothetical protein